MFYVHSIFRNDIPLCYSFETSMLLEVVVECEYYGFLFVCVLIDLAIPIPIYAFVLFCALLIESQGIHKLPIGKLFWIYLFKYSHSSGFTVKNI